MNDMKEPFITSVFTASLHHPFNIPDEYREKFPVLDDAETFVLVAR